MLLYQNKNKISIAPKELNQKISDIQYKIPENNCYEKEATTTISYLNNAIKDKNKHLTQYLIEYVIDFNRTCFEGNKELVEYFVEHRADINK